MIQNKVLKLDVTMGALSKHFFDGNAYLFPLDRRFHRRDVACYVSTLRFYVIAVSHMFLSKVLCLSFQARLCLKRSFEPNRPEGAQA